MEKKCRAYNGSETYGFISYAHADDARVLPVVNELYRGKYRFWYDEGIEVGANWPQKVAVRLKNSKLVVLFLSERFLRSQNCVRELNYGVAEKREMLCVLLEPVTLPEDMAMQLATVKKIDASSLTAREIVEEILKSGLLGRPFLGDGVEGYEQDGGETGHGINVWQIVGIVFALLFLGTAVFAVGYINGWFSIGIHRQQETVASGDGSVEQLTVTTWNDGMTRDLWLSSTNDRVIYLCGNSLLNLGTEITYKDGWYAGSQKMDNGGLSDLSVLKGKDLTHLAVVYQKLTDIGVLAEFENLVYLDLSGNEIADIRALKGLRKLETLKIQHIPATDLSVLKDMPGLKTVYVSEDMFSYAAEVLDGDFDVVVKK